MSRASVQQRSPRRTVGDANRDREATPGELAQDIANAALSLAKKANAAGLTTVGYLLECASLEAGAEAATRHSRADCSES